MPILHPESPRIPGNMFAERDVLKALRTLPPDAHVFARLAILDPKTNKDRELDFLVIHPELGLVIIEVKGRGVVPQGDHWIRKHPDGRVEVLAETPGEQLLAQQYSLLEFLRETLQGFVPQVTRVLAVPYLPLGDDSALGPDLPACRILTQNKLKGPYLALRSAVTGGQDWEAWKRTPEGRLHQVRPDVMRGLLEALTPKLLPPPTLHELLSEEGRLQDEAACTLLDHLASNFAGGRYSVVGGPGSGKSLLARQTARLWAAEGRRVLMVAFNRALTYATQCALDDLVTTDQVSVSTYHDLAANLLAQAGRKPINENDDQFFNHQLPDGLTALLGEPEAVSERWDALVVDEAQDLDPVWVKALLSLLHDPLRDPVLVLQDQAQSLYREARHDLGQAWRIDLSLRQHPALRRAACLAFPGCGWTPPDEVPDDGALTFLPSSPGTWRRDLEAQLHRLAEEGVEPQQVMVLSHRRAVSLGLQDGECLGPWELNAIPDWWEEEKARQLRVGTVHAFKGLEADVVIYLAPAFSGGDVPRLAYTAYSRARHRLIVLERAIPKAEAPREAPAAPLERPPVPPAPQAPQVRTFSEGTRQSLLGALTAAKDWKRKGPEEAKATPYRMAPGKRLS